MSNNARERLLKNVRNQTALVRNEMIERDGRDHPPIQFTIGQLASLRVPRKDRHATDNKRIICQILSIPHPGLYQLQTEFGVLKKKSPVRDLDIVPQSMSFDIRPNSSTKPITLRTAARLDSQQKSTSVSF